MITKNGGLFIQLWAVVASKWQWPWGKRGGKLELQNVPATDPGCCISGLHPPSLWSLSAMGDEPADAI